MKTFATIVGLSSTSICVKIFTSKWACVTIREFPELGCHVTNFVQYAAIAVFAAIAIECAKLLSDGGTARTLR